MTTANKHGYDANRDERGKFRATSGNINGRPPKKKKSIINPDAYRDMVFDIAEYKVEVTIDGRKMKLPLFQANLITLGAKGAHGDATAAKMFVTIIDQKLGDEFYDLRRAQNRVGAMAYIAKGTDAELNAASKVISDELMKRAANNRARVPSEFKRQAKNRQ